MHIFCPLHPGPCEFSFTICNLLHINTFGSTKVFGKKGAGSILIFLRSRRFKMCPKLGGNQSRPTGADSSALYIQVHLSFHSPSAIFCISTLWAQPRRLEKETLTPFAHCLPCTSTVMRVSIHHLQPLHINTSGSTKVFGRKRKVCHNFPEVKRFKTCPGLADNQPRPRC